MEAESATEDIRSRRHFPNADAQRSPSLQSSLQVGLALLETSPRRMWCCGGVSIACAEQSQVFAVAESPLLV